MTHSGYLIKKGGNRRNWKKRWFSLVDKVLQYSDGPTGKCLGTIKLETCLSVRSVRGR